MISLLDLLRSKVDASKVKKASGAKGGEWHSPCPICGGTDRFSVFPDQEGGDLCQKHGLRGTWSCVRGCGKGGDAISWFMEIEGMSFKEACAELQIPLEAQERVKRGYRPLRQPYAQVQPAFAPRSYLPPSEQWQLAATKLAMDAYHRIYDYPAIMNYLARRGLPQGAIDAYGLGYIEGEGKQPDGIYRARSAYGLPEKLGRDGKPLHAFRMPRGITIPVWNSDSRVLRIRLRRRDIDRDKSNPKDPKYLLVPQPGQAYSAPLMLYPQDTPPELATWVVTEAELDAMAVHYACDCKVGAISILPAKGKPDSAAHEALSRSARILVALDADDDKVDGSNPGAEAWLWWKQTYPQAKLWPVPEGKDPGEAFALGINLAQWIFAGTPLRKPLQEGRRICTAHASSTTALAPASSGSVPPVAIDGDDGSMGAQNAVVEKGAGEMEVFPVPTSVRIFSELQLPDGVSHRDLLNSQLKSPLDDPECILPCPKTDPPFWWRYYRDCKKFKCKGHRLCLLGVLRSPIFLEALNAEKNLSR